MADASTFRNILIFFDKLGIYDVLLPFLLVFSIVFAILEKTKVLGMDDFEGTKYTKKNLNAMVAFCIGFMVVASSQLVAIINQTASHIVLLLFFAIFFLLLVGSFMKESDDGSFLEGGWKKTFMGIMFVGIVVIFLNALPAGDNQTWLEWLIYQMTGNFDSTAVASIILIAIVVGMMFFITQSPKPNNSKE